MLLKRWCDSILGNLSSDQLVLVRIKKWLKTDQDFQRNKVRRISKKDVMAKLEKIKMDFIQMCLIKHGPNFFQDHLNLYEIVMIINGRKSSSCLFCDHDFAYERLLLCQMEFQSSKLNKIIPNCYHGPALFKSSAYQAALQVFSCMMENCLLI